MIFRLRSAGSEFKEIAVAYQLGQKVRLVPTQGAYQKDRQGTVTSITRTQVGVTADGERHEVRYRVEDGYPVRKSDREFPCFKISA